jgi:hypothetical protein
MFTLFDLVCYLLKVGRHSDRHLLNHQLLSLTSDTLALLKKAALSGDTLLTRPTNSISGWLILYVTNSPVSHTIIVGPDCSLLEAVPGGVRQATFEEKCDDATFGALVRLKDEYDFDADKMWRYAKAQEGTPYSYAGALRVGLMAIIGASSRYHPRTTLDIVLGLIAAASLVQNNPMMTGFIVGCAASFVSFVVLNIFMAYIAKGSNELMSMRPDDTTPGDIYMDAVRQKNFRFVIPLVNLKRG